ncbi:MAG: TspO/MBR family protein [Hyphomicrobiales bacterium]
MQNKWLVLAGFIVLCLAVGMAAGFATQQSIDDWYVTLIKPSWNPPNWLFAPVWTVLYVMMAVAAWLVWKQPQDTKGALILFFSQLALNFAWSFLFFGARSPWLGLIGVAFLLTAVAITTVVFWRITRPAGLLFVPYLAWTAFAAFLNLTIWRLN